MDERTGLLNFDISLSLFNFFPPQKHVGSSLLYKCSFPIEGPRVDSVLGVVHVHVLVASTNTLRILQSLDLMPTFGTNGTSSRCSMGTRTPLEKCYISKGASLQSIAR